jgi:transcriptional regulator with XRE-family HTH domain
MTHLNIVGPQIRKLRDQRGWSQSKFAALMQIRGWDLSRESLAKMECRLHEITDAELFWFAYGFEVPLPNLYPAIKGEVLLQQIRDEFLQRKSHNGL